ncbi:hypothetical protein Kisp02_02770 [Kineosporia sp. NBRC 101731]|nr:hypothetical protein Kisp02_02770 [Kineosporia sp. NBRC 101731]
MIRVWAVTINPRRPSGPKGLSGGFGRDGPLGMGTVGSETGKDMGDFLRAGAWMTGVGRVGRLSPRGDS